MWEGSYGNFNLHRSTHQDPDKRTVIQNDSEVEPELKVDVFNYDHYKWTEHRFTTSSQECSIVLLTSKESHQGNHLKRMVKRLTYLQTKFTCRLSTKFVLRRVWREIEVLRMFLVTPAAKLRPVDVAAGFGPVPAAEDSNLCTFGWWSNCPPFCTL